MFILDTFLAHKITEKYTILNGMNWSYNFPLAL